VDRHLDERKNQAALIWEGIDADEREHITYQNLYNRVNETAAALRDVDIAEDDVVTCHLPMLPALPVTMLACARIGAPIARCSPASRSKRWPTASMSPTNEFVAAFIGNPSINLFTADVEGDALVGPGGFEFALDDASPVKDRD
jgi:acyl-CoA synthetase (AMP-forming)/AMP-acid ligase II